MNLQLTLEQQMLRDSALRWVGEKTAAGEAAAAPGARWREMADLGWLGMTVPEADGGLGQGLADACVLAEALGTGPVAEPYIPAIVQAAELIATCGSAAQRERWLPALVAGTALVVPAHAERAAGHRLAHVATRAVRQGGAWVIDGVKSVVPAGDRADAWIVGVRIDERDDDASIALMIVEKGAAGVTAKAFETVDGAGACTLELRGVRVDDAARLPGATLADLQRVTDLALVVACAESVGAMETLLKTTVEYTRTRTQFGRPLAANQVLRHRMADMSVLCEEARSMTLGALLTVASESDAALRSRAAAAARAKVGLGARKVAEEAIQLHGGMGVTQELSVGTFLRRQLALDAMLGAAEFHLRRHAQLRPAGDGSEA